MGPQDGQDADVDELRARFERLEAEVASLRREQEGFGFELMGFEEREGLLRRGLERAGVFARGHPYELTRRAAAGQPEEPESPLPK